MFFKKSKDRSSETNECSTDEPEHIPPYLDCRYYDATGKDTEDAVAHGGDLTGVGRSNSGEKLTPHGSGTSLSLFNFGSDRGLTSPFKPDASKRSFVSSFNDLGLLNNPNSSFAISKDNRNDYIICKPVQKGGLPELRRAVQHSENPECLQINKDEWKASHIVAVFQNLDHIYQCLKHLQGDSEWSKTMNAPTPPIKRKSGKQNDTDSHIIGWTHQPRSGGSTKRYKEHMGAHSWIDVAMDEIKRYLGSTSDFPTRWGDDFPDDFDIITKRILQLCLNVCSHFYTQPVFFRLRENNLHTRLNKVFTHGLLLNEVFQMNLVNRKTHPLSDLIPVLIDD